MTGRLTVIEWLSIVIMVTSLGFIMWGPQGNRREPVDVGALTVALQVEKGPHGRPVARVDEEAVRATCTEVGLPDPPSLDGGDPVPIRKLLEQIERWALHRDLEALGQIGQIYQAIESHRAAFTCFVALAELDPENPAWHYAVGTEAQQLGYRNVAIAALERAREADPEYPTTLARLGLLYLEQGDLEAAEARYARCTEIVPNLSLGYVGLGRVAMARGDHVAAVRHLERAVAMTTNDFMAYRLLGRALGDAGRPEDARVASLRAEALPRYEGWLVFDPRLAEAHAFANSQRFLENQMREARGRGDLAAFITHGEELVRRRPDDYNTIGLLATAYAQLERFDVANASAKRALELQPDNSSMLSLLASIAFLEKDHARSLRILDRTIELDPTYAPAWDLRGRVLFALGRNDEAVESMREAIRLDPDNLKSSLALSDLLTRMERYDEAAEVLHAMLARSPGNPTAIQRLRTLETRTGTATPASP